MFIVGPIYIQYMNGQVYNFFKLNGGIRKDAMGGRPF
jgi:hypothetical protein